MTTHIFLQSAIQQFQSYKALADKAFEQIKEKDFLYQPNEVSNSIAIIITHLHGNMLSRWTHFLTEDGEKEWRKRDDEFEVQMLTRQQLLVLWEEGWACLLDALRALTAEDLNKTVYIRTKPLTVVEAIHRQLTHYASHVGQIVYICRWFAGNSWESLSIQKGNSQEYNQQMKNEN